jgi:hypothetical protein
MYNRGNKGDRVQLAMRTVKLDKRSFLNFMVGTENFKPINGMQFNF